MKVKFLMMCFLITILFTGCWDNIELDDRGFAISIGIDKIKDKEKEPNSQDRYSVTVSIANIASFASKDGKVEGDEARLLRTTTNETVNGALLIANDDISQQVDYSHTKLLVLGEELLKDEELLKEALDSIERLHKISQNLIVMSCEGDVEEIFKGEAGSLSMVGLFVENFYKNNSKQIANTFKINVQQLIKELRENSCAIIPKIGIKDKAVSIEGAGVVQDFKFAGWLTAEETTQYIFLREEGEGAELLADYGHELIRCRVSRQDIKFRFGEKDGKLVFKPRIIITGKEEEHILMGEKVFNSAVLKEMEKVFETEVKKEYEETLKNIKNSYEKDIFNIRDILHQHDYELWKKYGEDWEKTYKEMIFDLELDITIKSVGVTK